MIGTRLLDRYELTGELGRGGMGVVYRAHDPVLGREVAIKMIPPGRLESETEQRFQREARLVAQMDHPGIVPIHDLGSHDGALFFVMPWVQGALLRNLLDSDSPPDVAMIVEIGIQVAEALDYSHALGVVHRDIKPENIMVSGEGDDLRVRVMDFGLAMGATETRLTQTGSLIGSVHGIAPELIAKGESDARSDLYALGVVVYECLAGGPPFSGPIHKVLTRIVNEPADPFAARGVIVHPELEDVVLRCLEKNPADRPQRGRELAALLSACLVDLGSDFLQRAVEPPPIAPRGEAALPERTLIGRDAEVSVLQRRLNAAMNGECQLVLIGGEIGTGKSALLEELERQASARQALVLRGRFAGERGEALSFQGFCEVVRDGFRPVPLDAASGILERSAPEIGDLAAPLAERFPTLAEIPQIRDALRRTDSKPSPQRHLSKEIKNSEVFELLARTFVRLGGGRPLVLLIENLHSADISVEALQYIVHRMGPTPTLIVCTYRSEEVDRSHPIEALREAFLEDPRFSTVILGPLTGEDFAELVRHFLNERRSPDEVGKPGADLVRRLDDVAEGNPYFTSELVRALRRDDGLTLEDGVWRLSDAAGVSLETLPATIQQAVERRCESLSEPQRLVLRRAAVLGRRFDYEDLEDLLSDADLDEDLDDVIESLIRDDLLVEDTSTRDDLLTFAGGALRDVLYRETSRRRRRMLHRRHAAALEKRWAGRLERVYLRLVRHFAEGDVPDKTVEYAHLAARDALAKQSPEDALRLLRLALEWIEDDEVPDAARVRAELLLMKARACRALGRQERALRAAEAAAQAFADLRAPQEAAACALLAAQIAWHSRWTDASRKWIGRAIEQSRAAQAEETLEASLQLAATLANLRGDLGEGRALLAEVEELRRRLRPASEDEAPRGGVLTAAFSQPVKCLDPACLETDQEDEISANLFDTLLRFDDAGNLESELCSGWEREEGNRRFVLTLRSDVSFSDGTPLTAEIVKRSLERSARLGGDPAPAFPVLEGWESFQSSLRESADAEISGIAVDDRRLLFHLREPLPIFPVLLSDPKTAVALESAAGELLGTGPFAVESAIEGETEIVLRRNPSAPAQRTPRVERWVLRTEQTPEEIARGLEIGEVDLGRDLLPHDLENVLRHPQLRGGLVEATKKNVFYAIFHLQGPSAQHPELRRALCGAVRVRELVWRALGRFAQPAVSMIPPDVLGHDAGRRPPVLAAGTVRELLRRSGLETPIRLQAAIHPIFQTRYAELTESLFREWSAYGIEVVNRTPTLEAYFQCRADGEGIDLIMGRWNADYNDPESFTRGLFHSEVGTYRAYYRSIEADEVLDQARQEESAAARHALYQRFEARLLDGEHAVLPLFHDIDYRVAGPRLRGVALRSMLPYVNYAELGKDSAPRRTVAPTVLGEVRIPLGTASRTLDPIADSYSEHAELVSTLFEPLLRIADDTRIVPWIAGSIESQERGRIYSVHLRRDVRFHDGRRLTARDVRYTFERLLTSSTTDLRALLQPIRGSEALRNGDADELAGLEILGEFELRIILDEPFALFPALLTHPGAGIVAEGMESEESFRGSWRDGCVGTGPFRVLHFLPGERLELEGNPDYWRVGLPRCERLSFQLGRTPDAIRREFEEGELSMATGLDPEGYEAVRQNTEIYAEYLEAPRLATGFLALNCRSGPLADIETRRALRNALDLDRAVGELGHLAQRAHGLLPPGLLGYEPASESFRWDSGGRRSLSGLRLRGAALPIYQGSYRRLLQALTEDLEALGVEIEWLEDSQERLLEPIVRGEVDLATLRWIADYPDADAFAARLFSPGEGGLARLCGDEETARLAVAGRREAPPEVRRRIYRDLEEHLRRDVRLIPLFYEQTYRFTAASDRTVGIEGCRLGFSVPEVRYEEISPVELIGADRGGRKR